MSATLSHPSSAATTVTVTAVDGAYTVGADATITIPAGETANGSDTATVTAVNDAIDNVGNRSVTVTGTAANAQATADSETLTVNGVSLTLTDDEATPVATLALSEPDSSKPDTIAESGAGNASTVTATLDRASSEGGDPDGGGDGGDERPIRGLHAVEHEDAHHRGRVRRRAPAR